MTQPATDLDLTPRESLRWRRAIDVLLMDAIYGRVIRDTPLPADLSFVGASAQSIRSISELSITIG